MAYPPDTHAYRPVPRQRNNAGCLVSLSITLFVVMLLVIAGLFLPPFSVYERLFGEQFAYLTQPGDSIASSDNLFRVVLTTDPGDDPPGIRLQTTQRQAFESGQTTLVNTIPTARATLPANLALQSAVYSIWRDDTPAESLSLIFEQPISSYAASPDMLDVYGWYVTDEASGSGTWRFLPSQVNSTRLELTPETLPHHVAVFQSGPVTPTVLVSYPVTQALTSDVAQTATIISPGGLQPAFDGTVTGNLAPGFVQNAGYRVMPVIRDYADPRALDTETVPALLRNSELRRQHTIAITQVAGNSDFDGVFIDYRGLSTEDRENFSLFVRELSGRLAQVGRPLGVVVPAPRYEQGVYETGAYDWQVLGAYADYVQINVGLDPQFFIPGDDEPVESLLRYATRQINRYKLLIGLTARSIREIDGNFTTTSYDEALAGMGNVVYEAATVSETGSIEPGTEVRAYLDGMTTIDGVDTRINAPFVEYLNSDETRAARLWLTTGDALRFRMDQTVPFAAGGVAFEDIVGSGLADDVLPTIQDFVQQIPAAPAPTSLVLRWRIVDSDGDVIGETTTDLNEELVVTLSAPDGNYAINAVVEGAGQNIASVRTGVEVAQFSATATPTPLPTATPTLTPTVTPTPPPVQRTAAPEPAADSGNQPLPPGNPGDASLPAAGSILIGSGFEYGGHVVNPSNDATISAMRRSGMSWMKVQVVYRLGAGPGDAINAINAARAAGFKILIGTVGIPQEMADLGGAYNNEFARWTAGIASAGADAIEIWNEPNLAREWPAGQISGANYTNLLRASYAAIKAANPSTVVISGAPAPTGAENAYPGRVVNDDRFLRDMVAAGALQYADCVGVHYNEGIVSPTQRSGDPRDNYYTRYMGTLMDLYWNTIGGQRPLCFTELGYLTRDGYPPLPQAFNWASNVTLEQHAAWLAQAVAIASQSGKVRLLIVWNVDFTAYGADPQGGYAIRRPGGGCPACDTLSSAR